MSERVGTRHFLWFNAFKSNGEARVMAATGTAVKSATTTAHGTRHATTQWVI